MRQKLASRTNTKSRQATVESRAKSSLALFIEKINTMPLKKVFDK